MPTIDKTSSFTAGENAAIASLFRSISPYSLPTLMFLYGLSLLTSMAGMEIFGWLTALNVFLIWITKKYQKKPSWPAMPMWHLLLAFWLLAAVSAWHNGYFEEGHFKTGLDIVGNFRWILLLFSFFYAWKILKIPPKTIKFFFAASLAIGLYAFIQYFWGIDILRETDRAVQPIRVAPFGEIVAWRSAGLYSSPMTYAYSFGLVFCLHLAFVLLDSKRNKKVYALSIFSTLVIGTSLLTTYTRGCWVALAATCLTGTYLINKKFTLKIFLIMTTAVLTFSLSSETFRKRLTSIFSSSHGSNDVRLTLWKANTDLALEHPWLGVGYGRASHLLSSYYKEKGIENGFVGHAHNNFFEVLSGIGLTGLTLYLLIMSGFFFMSWTVWKYHQNSSTDKEHSIQIISFGILMGQIFFHVGGLTQCNFTDGEVNHLFILLMSYILYHYSEIKGERIAT